MTNPLVMTPTQLGQVGRNLRPVIDSMIAQGSVVIDRSLPTISDQEITDLAQNAYELYSMRGDPDSDEGFQFIARYMYEAGHSAALSLHR
jgi:hypothetical protein